MDYEIAAIAKALKVSVARRFGGGANNSGRWCLSEMVRFGLRRVVASFTRFIFVLVYQDEGRDSTIAGEYWKPRKRRLRMG